MDARNKHQYVRVMFVRASWGANFVEREGEDFCKGGSHGQGYACAAVGSAGSGRRPDRHGLGCVEPVGSAGSGRRPDRHGLGCVEPKFRKERYKGGPGRITGDPYFRPELFMVGLRWVCECMCHLSASFCTWCVCTHHGESAVSQRTAPPVAWDTSTYVIFSSKRRRRE